MGYGDNKDTGIKLKGDLLITDYGPGWEFLGMQDPVNVTLFELDPGSGEIKTHDGKGVSNEGQVLSAWVDEAIPKIKLAFDSLPISQLSDVMRGLYGLNAQASGSMTDEPITLILDRWVRAPFQQLAGGSVVLNGVGGTPLHVENTDFEVQYQHGLLKALTAPAAGLQELDADYAAITRSKAVGPSSRNAQVGLSLLGQNKTNGATVEFVAEKCLMVYTATLALVGGDEVVSVTADVVPIGDYSYEEWI